MKRNEEKLDQMVEAVSNLSYTNEIITVTPDMLRTALTPFCMEMTDEEIAEERKKIPLTYDSYQDSAIAIGFMKGAKFIRDGK